MGVVAILGSARSEGHAARLLNAVLAGRPARRFDLGALDIRDYAYGRPTGGDDFAEVAQAIAESSSVLFVTPVYWYAMSGVLKRFFDRLTDLVTVDKPLGRRLAGRSVWVAACGSDPALPEGFEVPFQQTAAYFGMRYGGALYVPMPGERAAVPRAQVAGRRVRVGRARCKLRQSGRSSLTAGTAAGRPCG